MLNSRKENETFYGINSVELSDEALLNVVGGCGGDNDCDHNGGWDDDNSNCNSWAYNGYSANNCNRDPHCRPHGLLVDVLGILL